MAYPRDVVRLCDGGHSRICADCDPQDGDGFGGSSWPWSAKSHLDFLVGAFSWNAALRNRWFADSLLQGSGFEPVWGFSCQVVFWFVGGSLYYHARSGCSSNRCRRASSICLIWPITNLSRAMSRSSSAATFGGNGEPSGVDRAARCSAALRRVGLKLRMPSRARLPLCGSQVACVPASMCGKIRAEAPSVAHPRRCHQAVKQSDDGRVRPLH